MRIRLQQGKQKELIDRVKRLNNFSWKQMASFFGVKRHIIVSLSTEQNLINKDLFHKLDSSNNYAKYIIETKKDNWGKSKGGLNFIGNTKNIRIPEESPSLAELIGIILGEGNIYFHTDGRRTTYMVRIAGDLTQEKDYLLNHVRPLCANLFNIKPTVILQQKNNELFVCLNSRNIVEFLGEKGLKKGSKIKNQTTIPKWIKSNKGYLRACVRGLIDTDGSIFRMSKRDSKLLRINFKNYDKTLLKDTRNALLELGFNPSKIICGKAIFLSRKENINKYIKEIGFSNKKHINRLLKLRANSPVV